VILQLAYAQYCIDYIVDIVPIQPVSVIWNKSFVV